MSLDQLDPTTTPAAAEAPAEAPPPMIGPQPAAPAPVPAPVTTSPPDVAPPAPEAPRDTGIMREGAQIFGSFWIGGTEFALPVDFIQEVVNEPEAYSRVPLSPSHMVGLFSLRGTIIPVIDMRVLLDISTPPAPASRKIAIIENGDQAIGLLFDETGRILSSESAVQVRFTTNTDGDRDVIVEGVLKFDQGKTMVQVLNPYEILRIKRLPRSATASESGIGAHHRGNRVNCISFQLGHTNCAIDLRYVQEVTDVPDIQTSQIAHGHILGNIDLRGRTIPVIDFRGVMGNEPPFKFSQAALANRKLLILALEEGHVALLVYSIDSILPYFESDVMPFANVALPRQDIIAGCLINDRQEIVILLDHARLMKDAGIVEAAKSCQEIYPSEEVAITTTNEIDESQRCTFIVFRVERLFALDISYVSEVINHPDTVLKPPYVLSFVKGILNLRGELITLIDPRKLYDLPHSEVQNPKVLIFQSDGRKYGMVVDSVDEIVSSIRGTFISAPSLKTDKQIRVVSQDVLGCLTVSSRNHASEPIMVLNVDALLARCVDAETL